MRYDSLLGQIRVRIAQCSCVHILRMGIAHGRSFDVTSCGLTSFERRSARERVRAVQKRRSESFNIAMAINCAFRVVVAPSNVSQSTSVSRRVQVGDNYIKGVKEGIAKKENKNLEIE